MVDGEVVVKVVELGHDYALQEQENEELRQQRML